MSEMSEKEYRLKNDYPKTYPQDLKEKLYIIDEKKRAQMRKYYDRASEVQNKQKIILRAKNNPEYCPQEATLSKYDWTDAEKNTTANTTTTDPQRNTKDTLSRDEIFEILDAEEGIAEATKKQWKSVINNFVKVFSLQASKWTDLYTKYTNDEIIEMLKTAYTNETTRIKQVQLTPKFYNAKNASLVKIIGIERWKFFDTQANVLQRSIQSGKIGKKLSDKTDYVDDFINVFKSELELRKKKPSSMDHLIAMLYSIGMCLRKKRVRFCNMPKSKREPESGPEEEEEQEEEEEDLGPETFSKWRKSGPWVTDGYFNHWYDVLDRKIKSTKGQVLMELKKFVLE
eukprot:gene23122-27975_t